MFEDLKKEKDINKSYNFRKKKIELLDSGDFKNDPKNNLDYSSRLNNFKKSFDFHKEKKQIVPQKNKINNKKNISVIFIIFFLVILILVGGGWFYYVKGEAMLLSSQMQWDWGAKTDIFLMENDLFLKIHDLNIKNESEDLLMTELIPENLILNSNSSFKSIKDDGEGKFNLEIDFGPVINLALDFKKIEKDLYLKPKITGLRDVIPFLSIPDIDSGDEWILLDEEVSDIPFYNFENKDPNSLAETFQSELEDKIPSFLEDLKDKNIFIIEDPHEVRELDGSELKKINYFLKKDKVDDFIFLFIDLMAEDEEEAYVNKEEFIQNKQNKSEEWNNLKKFIQDLEISLWIDKKNKIIRGLNLKLDNFEINTNDFKTMIDLEFSNLVKDIQLTDISIPENYITSVEFLEGIQNSFKSTSLMPEDIPEVMEKSSDDILDAENYLMSADNEDTDGDGILNYIEEIIGTNINNEDTDGDGYLDGEEIENGYSPLGPEALEPEVIDFYKQIMKES